jgi:hypothetical protein
MATDQFDNYQLDPNALGSDWVFSGDQVHGSRSPNSKISNYNMYFVGARSTIDRTRTVLGGPDPRINPPRVIGAGYSGHGVDWAEFNYNPYSKVNPNFRVYNDYLTIWGLGSLDVDSHDVVGYVEEAKAEGMLQYRNYPTEGYNSFGKKTGGASPDKRWVWHGNTWVPAA